MNKAVLYQNSNGVQRNDAEQVFNEFSSVWKWRSNGRDTLLDVGCGSGDVTIDLILPFLPDNFERLVECDISDEMVNHARHKVSFERFDLSIDIEMQSILKLESFDHITSFYCLMWVHNQRMAVQNLYKATEARWGLIGSVIGAQCPVYDFYKEQSQDDRWAKYMTDTDKFISPYQHSMDPTEDFRKHLIDCRFTECKVDAREKHYICNGIDNRNVLKSTNPFIDRFLIPKQSKFLEDLVQKFGQNELALDDFHANSDKCRYATPYKQVVVYARK